MEWGYFTIAVPKLITYAKWVFTSELSKYLEHVLGAIVTMPKLLALDKQFVAHQFLIGQLHSFSAIELTIIVWIVCVYKLCYLCYALLTWICKLNLPTRHHNVTVTSVLVKVGPEDRTKKPKVLSADETTLLSNNSHMIKTMATVSLQYIHLQLSKKT